MSGGCLPVAGRGMVGWWAGRLVGWWAGGLAGMWLLVVVGSGTLAGGRVRCKSRVASRALRRVGCRRPRCVRRDV